ncbi:MAG: hypothetical protein NZ777_08665 [Pseudomonadales bacterium]|nr:hypothetical protein [Pseudomonadales bacterium]
MKSSGRQFFLWHLAICCIPLLLVYISIFGLTTITGWLTSTPFLLIVSLVVVVLVFPPAFLGQHDGKKTKNNKSQST